MITSDRYREVMASFPSGVVIITAFGDDGRPRGLTVDGLAWDRPASEIGGPILTNDAAAYASAGVRTSGLHLTRASAGTRMSRA